MKENYNLTYKATYKAIQELTQENILEKDNNEYKLNEQWLKTTANTALEVIKNYKTKSKLSHTEILANFGVYHYSDEFYRILIIMLNQANEIRLASKTPAILMKKESTKSFLRKQYTETLWRRLEEGMTIYYLFPTETLEKFIEQQGKTQFSQLMKKLETYPNLQIRHAPMHSVVKMAITEKEALIGLASPPNTDLTSFLKIEGANLKDLSALYNSIFANGKTIFEL
ncbi:MAG: hypothetical protein V1722_04075 [Candidatus Micrarchaeota archaeon]